MRKFIMIALLMSTAAFAAPIKPFALPQMNASPIGTSFTSASHPGRAWVIENYFNSCSYCNENAPQVNDLADFYKDNARVLVIDLGIDRQDAQYATWISNHAPNHPVLKDSSRSLTNQFGTTGYPSTYVMNCKMEVTWSHSGVWDAASLAEIKDKIDEALSVECPFLW